MLGHLPTVGVTREIVIRRYEAQAYDRDMARYLASIDQGLVKRMDQRITDTLENLLRENSHPRILIPAVGSGRALRLLEPFVLRGAEVDGIDFNDAMLVASRKLVASSSLLLTVRLANQDILSARDAFPSGSFDLIIWEYSGCVVIEPQEAWKLMIDLLKPGGLLIYNDYVGSPHGRISRSQNDLRDAARTVGMRWFNRSELPTYLLDDSRIYNTNGIMSVVNEGVFHSRHAIVWDPTYPFVTIASTPWFTSSLDIVDLEIQSNDVMQSNVSAVYRRRPTAFRP
jgi:SAM-dependent methyltransferase